MSNGKKQYIGGINSEEEAARIYDEIAIRSNGLRAKTNFSYTKQDLLILISKFINVWWPNKTMIRIF